MIKIRSHNSHKCSFGKVLIIMATNLPLFNLIPCRVCKIFLKEIIKTWIFLRVQGFILQTKDKVCMSLHVYQMYQAEVIMCHLHYNSHKKWTKQCKMLKILKNLNLLLKHITPSHRFCKSSRVNMFSKATF